MKNFILLSFLFITLSTFAQEPGAIDLNFQIGSGANGNIKAIAVQNDGKILIGGAFTEYNGVTTNRIARLNADGSLDVDFNTNAGTGFDGWVHCIKIQSNNQILVGGEFRDYNGTAVQKIVRLNADGTVDGSYNLDHGFTNSDWFIVESMDLQSDDRLVFGGFFQITPVLDDYTVARLNYDGTFDASFTKVPYPNLAHTYSIAVQNDDKIVAAGAWNNYMGIAGANYLVRLNANGTMDNSFSPPVLHQTVMAVAIQNDGKIIAGGQAIYYGGLVRLNTNGSVDTAFDHFERDGAAGLIYTVASQNNNKIIAGGLYFSSYNTQSTYNIARINNNSSLDSTFVSGTGANNGIYSCAIQPDGKIILGGIFTDYNGFARNRLVRIGGGDCTAPSIAKTVSDTVCYGNSAQLVATATAGSVRWFDAPSGGNLLAIDTVYVTPNLLSTNTTYYVEAINNYCVSPTRTSVVATITTTDITSTTNDSICAGSDAVLNATTTNGIINWYDAPNNGNFLATGNDYNPSAINNPTTFYVDVTYDGCTSATRTSVFVNLYTTPTITSSISEEFCSDVLTYHPIISDVPSYYNWIATDNNNTEGESLTGQQGATMFFNIHNLTTTQQIVDYTVTFTSMLGGCVGSPQTVSAIVNPKPVVEFGGLDLYYCTNQPSSTLIGSPAGGTFSGNGITGDTFNPAAVTGSQTITYDYTSTSGCNNNSSQTIQQLASPIKEELCMVSVDSTSTKNVLIWQHSSSAATSHYNIYRDAASSYTLINSVAHNMPCTYTDVTAGINPNITQYRYKISVVDTCGNESAQSLYHQTIWLDSPTPISGGYKLNWYNYAIENTNLSGSYYYRIEADTNGLLAWYPVDSVSNGITVYNHATLTNTVQNINYRVVIIVPGGCDPSRATVKTSRSNIKTSTRLVGLNNLNTSLLMSVFPSPAKNTVRINSNEIISSVELTDLLGKMIIQQSANEASVILDLSNLSEGTYFIKSQIKGEFLVRKLLIDK